VDDGQVDVSNAPGSVTLVSSDDGTINAQSLLCITVPADGTMEFDWDYVTSDVDGPLFDPFGYTIDGVYTQLTDDDGPIAQSGSVSITGGGSGILLPSIYDGWRFGLSYDNLEYVCIRRRERECRSDQYGCGVTLSYEAPALTTVLALSRC
jgi:hypothetical protein